ncbi:hypothetical protein LJC68_06510 [Bacteroidales bacterium OttesenSCG-928-B11]|nr:hypothetical protein [Bacteroidales bacterium OttesenSCG-928-E04]MDL2309419.1 hypothetical protein [Bacteroidales bacterium OttesenSCG-928-C03]MDL2312511.1 hypothetical protein [Bacteroidales bacterium OttesenSCG-928-B11]
MKKNKIIPIIIFALSLCIGCKDIGDKYTGDWDFVTVRSLLDYDYVEIEKKTIHYSGKISPGDYENRVIIQYTENDAIGATISKEEDYICIYSNSLASYGGKYASGSFPEKDKIDMVYSKQHFDSNGHSDGIIYDYINGTKKGKRKKGK